MANINNIRLFGTKYDLNDIRIEIAPHSSWTVITVNDRFVIAYGNRKLVFPNPTLVGGTGGAYRSIEEIDLSAIMNEVYGGNVGYLNGYSVPSIVPHGANKHIAQVVFTYNTPFSGFTTIAPTVIFGVK